MATSRAQREASFRAIHGVSSGTYYEMRRKATDRGISPKTFDAIQKNAGYKAAKQTTQIAATDIAAARHNAAQSLGLIKSDMALSDFDDSMDYNFPDDFDWWYH